MPQARVGHVTHAHDQGSKLHFWIGTPRLPLTQEL